MVGQEEHRLAGGRNLQGAADQALAGQLVAPGPLEGLALEPQPDAVAVAGDRPGLLDQGRPTPRRGTSPGVARGSPAPSRPRPPGRPRPRGRRRASGAPACRRRARRPPTAPPARARSSCPSRTTRGLVRRRNRPAPRRTSAVRWSVRRAPARRRTGAWSGALWCQEPSHRAPVVTMTTSPSARSRSPPYVTSSTGAPSALPTSRFASRYDARSHAPERPTPRDAWPGRPASCTVVSSPGLQHRQRRRHGRAPSSTKRTRTPGRRIAAGSRAGSNMVSAVRPISCQPPGDSRG